MPTFWHPYARRQALRTLEYVAAITAAFVVLVMLTDEPGSTARMRIARVGALSPAVVAIAIWAVLGQADSRGELRALATLGARPVLARVGALSTGWCVLLAALTVLLVLPESDLASLFPRAASSIQWSVDALGAWVAPSHAVTVFADGTLRLGQSKPTNQPGAADLRVAVAAAFGPLALVVPLWAAQPMPRWTRGATGGVAVLLMLGTLHAVAARELSESTLALVAAPLWLGLARRGNLAKQLTETRVARSTSRLR